MCWGDLIPHLLHSSLYAATSNAAECFLWLQHRQSCCVMQHPASLRSPYSPLPCLIKVAVSCSVALEGRLHLPCQHKGRPTLQCSYMLYICECELFLQLQYDRRGTVRGGQGRSNPGPGLHGQRRRTLELESSAHREGGRGRKTSENALLLTTPLFSDHH